MQQSSLQGCKGAQMQPCSPTRAPLLPPAQQLRHQTDLLAAAPERCDGLKGRLCPKEHRASKGASTALLQKGPNAAPVPCEPLHGEHGLFTHGTAAGMPAPSSTAAFMTEKGAPRLGWLLEGAHPARHSQSTMPARCAALSSHTPHAAPLHPRRRSAKAACCLRVALGTKRPFLVLRGRPGPRVYDGWNRQTHRHAWVLGRAV